jgi:hypothetical protein
MLVLVKGDTKTMATEPGDLCGVFGRIKELEVGFADLN